MYSKYTFHDFYTTYTNTKKRLFLSSKNCSSSEKIELVKILIEERYCVEFFKLVLLGKTWTI